MKTLYWPLSIVLLFLTGIEAISQKGWLNQYYGEAHVEVGKMCIDPDDNLLTVGNFSDDVNIQGHLYTGGGGFLLKLTSAGALVWHKKFTYSNPVSFSSLTDVQTDGEGNVYISGQYPESVTIDAVTLAGMPSSHNSFLAKFNADGQLQWTKEFKDVQNVFDLSVNQRGDVAIYARHYGALTIDDATISSNGNAIGVLFSTDGVLQWAKSIQTGFGHSTWPVAITLDESGNTYLNGKFSESLQIDSKQVTSEGGHYDMFFAKLNEAGICEWLIAAQRKVPSAYATSNPPNGLVVEFGDLIADADGSLYATGTYWTEMKIESVILPGEGPTSPNTNFFLLKLNPAGTLAWVRNTLTPTQSTACFIVSRHEKLYVSGVIGNAPYFTVYNHQGTRLTDPIVLPLDGDIGGGFGVDSEDSVYLSGRRLLTWYEPPQRGFVLKYGEELDYGVVDPVPPPPLGSPGGVSGPVSVCINNGVQFETTAIAQATSYEWEISHNGAITNYITVDPVVVIPLNTINNAGDLKVRVRGLRATETGAYSNYHHVTVEIPQELLLTSTCREITLSKGGIVEWYGNNELIQNIPGTQRGFTPEFSGYYFVTASNACGIQKSNVIEFAVSTSDAYFIPNIITPDGDDFNQSFVLDEKLDSCSVSVLNRWGSEVYSSPVYENNWSGDGLPVGIYYYIIKNPCLAGPLKGTLTIAR